MPEPTITQNYSLWARGFALKYPFLNSILIQMSFWVNAYLLLIGLFVLNVKGLSINLDLEIPSSFWPPFILSGFIGFSYGFLSGVLMYYPMKKMANRPLWMIVLIQVLVGLLLLTFIMFLGHWLLFDILVKLFFDGISPFKSFDGFFYYIIVAYLYTFIMSVLLSFIVQMNKKFGPGVIIPMLLGRYRSPIEEQRIFMFIDLKNSTGYAEKLGHIMYSQLIRDCFRDINAVIPNHLAEIYQYVGDGILLTWECRVANAHENAIRLFSSVNSKLKQNEKYYEKNYGLLPDFKASVHSGLVTAVEVGDVKREIAYHGDVLNVCARLLDLCKKLKVDFLVTEPIIQNLQSFDEHAFESMGSHELRGRSELLKVYNVILL